MTIPLQTDVLIADDHAGRVQEAGYRAVLQADPGHPVANHNMGVLMMQKKQPALALPFFLAALESDPGCGQYWLGYIGALIEAKELDAASEVLTLARQQGLQGDEVEALALCLSGAVGKKLLGAGKSISGGRDDIDTLTALFTAGLWSGAVDAARAMTVAYPKRAFGWSVLGLALSRMGRHKDALIPLKKTVALSPNDAQAHSNLGNLFSDLERPYDAESSLRRALKINPRFAEAHVNLGATLHDLGRLNEARASYGTALKINPELAQAHFNLGNTLKELGLLDEAESSYRRALQIKPDYADAYSNLGIVQQESGQLDEALASLRSALGIRPDDAKAHSNLGRIYQDMGRFEEAVSSYVRALQITPDSACVLSNLGCVLHDMGRLKEAEARFRRAIEMKPDYAEAHSNLGVTLQEAGRLLQARACFERALELDADYLKARSNLLFILNYLSVDTPFYCLGQAREYGKIVSRKAAAGLTARSFDELPKRLRIGFVSGDFRNHPVGYFLEGLLASLDSSRVELFAYSANDRSDELTLRIKPHFSHWTRLIGCSDEAAARKIQADGIHVLFDLSGHTLYNRLPVFAWKAAPIQVSWLGYFATTGMAEMDYLLGDRHVAPASEAGHFTETLWQLPDAYLCFTKPDVDLDVLPLPALSCGYVTFGCFNNLMKVNDAMIAIWSKILMATPGSRLFLKARQLGDTEGREAILQGFSAHGVDAERLILEGASPRAALLASYHRVDIALDTFPYPGGTTSVEGLWMGVPMLTRCGDRFLSHVGQTIAVNAGLSDWIAVDADDYVAKAAGFARDINRLAVLRAGLRQQVLASPLFDASGFARHFEQAVWDMWQTHLNKKGIS